MPTSRNRTRTGTPMRAENLFDTIPSNSKMPVIKIRASILNMSNRSQDAQCQRKYAIALHRVCPSLPTACRWRIGLAFELPPWFSKPHPPMRSNVRTGPISGNRLGVGMTSTDRFRPNGSAARCRRALPPYPAASGNRHPPRLQQKRGPPSSQRPRIRQSLKEETFPES